MATKTYQEQLDSVQAAIAEIEGGGQSATALGRNWTGADLGTLYNREKWLRAQVARESRGGGARVRLARPLS